MTQGHNHAPTVIFWEITRACALACRHCRAKAQPRRHPLELTTEEGLRLLDQMADFGNRPVVVITGGDPLMRPDVFQFISYGLNKGLMVSLSPSVTALVRPKTLRWLREAGLSRISFSLDGANPEVHDSFRGVPGAFQRTQECITDAVAAGLSFQINTTVTRHSLPELPALAELLARSGAAAWDVFFLVPTGRALQGDMITPEEHEQVFHWLYDQSRGSPFAIRVTLGQPYRRVLLQRGLAGGGQDPPDAARLRVPTTNDGKGVCFISHIGEVQPSGFLPLPAGDVRDQPLTELYRHSPLFQELRDPSLLKGKCGICPFQDVCGGCRARAYGLTGDYLESDPCCVYQPDLDPPPPEVLRSLHAINRVPTHPSA